MIAKAICFIWLIGILAPASVAAQTGESLLDQIEHSVHQKRPDWKFVTRRVSKNRKYGAYRLRSGKSLVNVLVFVHDSTAEANKTYRTFDLEDFGLKRTMLKETRLDLGEENYAWEGSHDKRITGIDFRQGKVFVHITAPTIKTAKQVALLIAEVIPAARYQ